jgi:hypothetical protein
MNFQNGRFVELPVRVNLSNARVIAEERDDLLTEAIQILERTEARLIVGLGPDGLN